MGTIAFSIEKRQNKIEWCKIKTRYYGPACINQPHGLGKRKSLTKVHFAFLKFRLNFTFVVSPWYSWTPVLSNCKRFCHASDANKQQMKLRCDHRSGNQGFSGIRTCVNAAVLYQLSYEDSFVESKPIYGVGVQIIFTRDRNETWNEINLNWGIQLKLRCDHRSCNRNLSNCKFAGLHYYFFVGRSSYLCSLTEQGISYF